MTEFNFKVGDRLTCNWMKQTWAQPTITITAIGEQYFIAKDSTGEEDLWDKSGYPDDPWYMAPKRYVVEFRQPRIGERFADTRYPSAPIIHHNESYSIELGALYPVIVEGPEE